MNLLAQPSKQKDRSHGPNMWTAADDIKQQHGTHPRYEVQDVGKVGIFYRYHYRLVKLLSRRIRTLAKHKRLK